MLTSCRCLYSTNRTGQGALLDANALLQKHVDHRSEAIGGAGGVGHHVVAGLVVLGVVHAAHQGLQLALAWVNESMH